LRIQRGNPNTTGVLPVALMKATKIIQTLLPAGKEYMCVMRLHKEIPETKIHRIAAEFVGEIYQRPPVRSSVVRRLRIREIYYLNIFEIKDRYVLFKIGCQAGFYVRMLCHHLGLAFGTGAHMRELRRTRAGPFREDETLTTLYELKDAIVWYRENRDETPLRHCILPLESALNHIPKIIIRDSAIDAVCHGAKLAAPGVLQLDSKIEKGSIIAIFSLKGEAVALGKAILNTSEILEVESGLVAETNKVLMERGTYPSYKKL